MSDLTGGEQERMPGAIWDRRTGSLRAAAHRFPALAAHADAAGIRLDGDLRAGWPATPTDLARLALRTYQAQALAAWDAFGRRGVIAIATGGGKTRIAIGAVGTLGVPTAILCPTRALAAQWIAELGRWFDEPIGLVGDGDRRVERLTVLTFESAYRHMDALGDRFGLLVVDEVHHFGTGARIEALEACAATARLGLTATAPDPGSEALKRIEQLIGPIVFDLGHGELAGTHLAPLDIVRIPVALTDDERSEYARLTRGFSEHARTFFRTNPDADFVALTRALGRSPGGRRALVDHAAGQALASFPAAKRRLVGELLDAHRSDRSIVFTAFAENAYAIASENLIPVIAAETSSRERSDILRRFRDGPLRSIASARVLNEGIDVPDARVAIVVAGVLGRREHVQRIGRVLRPAPGKRALLYELVTIGTNDARRAARRASAVKSARHASGPTP